MKSKTKFSVTTEMIQNMVSKHFPKEDIDSIEELTDGMFNSAYAVWGTGIMKNGVVLKIGPASGTELLTYEQGILHTEAEVYKLLEDRPIRTPKILACDYSHEDCMERVLYTDDHAYETVNENPSVDQIRFYGNV